MTPYEMMLSESQERMLIILEDGKENHARQIFSKWDLDFVVIGKTTDTKKLIMKYNNKIEGEIPLDALSSKHQYTIESGQEKNFKKQIRFKKT